MDKNAIETMVEEIRTMKEGLETEKRDFEARMANYNAPINTANAEKAEAWRDVKNAMVEKRAITVGGTGKVNLVADIIKECVAKTPLLDKVRFFTGRDSETRIPVWSPSIAQPVAYAEGATGIVSDTQAVLGVQSIQPYAYVSILPVSDATLLMSGANLEAELPQIFAQAFNKALHAGIVSGDGTGKNMTGLFKATGTQTIECGASGSPKMADVVALALKLQDYYDNGCIVMNPAIYSAITAVETGDALSVYREELIRNKTIEGIKVILTSYAPSATTAGSVVAVGGDLSEYAVGMANALTIEPFREVGQLNTMYRGIAYWNGCPILAKNFVQLKAV